MSFIVWPYFRCWNESANFPLVIHLNTNVSLMNSERCGNCVCDKQIAQKLWIMSYNETFYSIPAWPNCDGKFKNNGKTVIYELKYDFQIKVNKERKKISYNLNYDSVQIEKKCTWEWIWSCRLWNQQVIRNRKQSLFCYTLALMIRFTIFDRFCVFFIPLPPAIKNYALLCDYSDEFLFHWTLTTKNHFALPSMHDWICGSKVTNMSWIFVCEWVAI